MDRKVNIACLQTCAFGDAADALVHAIELGSDAVANGARLLVLPEYSGGLKTDGKLFAPPVFTEDAHPVLNGMRAFAEKHSVWVVLGSVAIASEGSTFFNRCFVIDEHGEIQARNTKIHLFDIELSATQSYKESEKVLPGGEAVIVDTPFGKLGLSICYDLRFPQLFRDLAQAGAEILLVPAAFTKKTGQAHWHILNQARAIENGAYVIAPCAVGRIPGGGESFGHSLVIDPWGTIVADGGEETGVVQCEIDVDQVAITRGRIPSLSHDKPYQLHGCHEDDTHSIAAESRVHTDALNTPMAMQRQTASTVLDANADSNNKEYSA